MAYRFIPVYTGNTDSVYSEQADKKVYPCVYREHIAVLGVKGNNVGLSLCIQGTLYQRHLKMSFIRFIPVYTGNTIDFDQHSSPNAVYPCVYREHSKYI